MRRSVLFACVILALTVVPAFSANIGPVKSGVADGETAFGLGYTFTDSKWEDTGSFSSLELQQNRFFAQAGYGISDNWFGYARGGLSTLKADSAFLNVATDFEGENIFPFVSIGANGLFFENDVLSIGGFVQGSYYLGENEDSVKTAPIIFDSIAQSIKETVTVDQMWEARGGLELQMELEGAQLYCGPMYYISRADIEDKMVGAVSGVATVSKTIEEEDNFGFVAGVQWNLLKDVTLDFEAQLRSSYDIGFVLNKRF